MSAAGTNVTRGQHTASTLTFFTATVDPEMSSDSSSGDDDAEDGVNYSIPVVALKAARKMRKHNVV
jgi:hypothetical protein